MSGLIDPADGDFSSECNAINEWIDDIISSYSDNVYIGMNEQNWLAENTDDGIHYNTAGQTVCASKWLEILS